MNNIKSVLLLALLTGILIAAGGALGGRQGMTVALVMAFAMNFFAYWFSDKVVLRMYGARQVSESEQPGLYATVRELASKAGMPMPKVYVIDAAQPNAFATGRSPSHAAVAVTTGIMRILSAEELRGVIGHELAHVKHRDVLIGTIAATIGGAISYLAYMAQWAAIFGGRDDRDGSPLALLATIIVAPIAALIVQMAVSRSREYEADSGGARLAGNPRYLANALRRLAEASKKIPMKANPATSHLFIVNPLSGGGMAKLFSTHPPIEERIRRLEQMA
ncbi:MAG: zinc metalloprotease HtpX [Thermodesulfovibrionales bacterium]